MFLRLLVVSCLAAVLSGPSPTIAAITEPQRQQPVPRPFPRPESPGQDPTRASTEEPAEATPSSVPSVADQAAPTEATLGFPIYPSARYLTSYDAGRNQRYYLFGTNSTFEEMVQYYAIVLDERGDRVFDAPATHVFEVGRFSEEDMAFPPGVTVKDYTWNGSDGYLHTDGSEAERFKTVIQVVPTPPEQTRRQ